MARPRCPTEGQGNRSSSGIAQAAAPEPLGDIPPTRGEGTESPRAPDGARPRPPEIRAASARGWSAERAESELRARLGWQRRHVPWPLTASCSYAEQPEWQVPDRVRSPGGERRDRRRRAEHSLTSCSAQRQMSEQRPVQQPMVPATPRGQRSESSAPLPLDSGVVPSGARRSGPGSPAKLRLTAPELRARACLC